MAFAMRTPLNDVLHDDKDSMAGADPGRGLAVLFETAEKRENAYAAERLREIYEVAERAMSLGAETARAQSAPVAGGTSLSQRAASIAAGLLLAATAPLVAAESVLLAAASGLGAAAALAVPLFGGGRRQTRPALPAPDPQRRSAKLEAVAAAADRALQAMVEPRRLPSPAAHGPALSEEDVVALIQDALALGRETEGEAAAELAENAGRLARRLGYTPVFEGGDELFEVMLDPALGAPLVVRPALVHREEGRSVLGVMVKGRQN
jgi:hypothetical protein